MEHINIDYDTVEEHDLKIMESFVRLLKASFDDGSYVSVVLMPDGYVSCTKEVRNSDYVKKYVHVDVKSESGFAVAYQC